MSTPAGAPPVKRKVKSGQGIFSVWQGMTFGTWLRFLAMRPPMDWTEAPRIALITALSMNNSVMGALEWLLFGGKVKRTELNGPPVFILGHWRSGTTLLHNLLAEDQRFVTPNTYQVINPHHFLLTEDVTTRYTKWLLPKTRPMDNMSITWQSPQEDESALLNLTLSSAYLMLAYQAQPQAYERYFELRDIPPKELARWKEAFLTYLKKLTVKTGRQILLKSPTHSYRIPILLEMFPEAYFINITRNPYEVYNSTVHLRRKMFEANGLGCPNYSRIEEDVKNTYSHLVRCYERDRPLIRPERLYEIRYEELEKDPVGEMEKIYSYFHWDGFDRLKPVIEAQLPSLREYKKNEFKMDLELKREIYQRFKPAFDQYGYPSGLEESTSVTPAQ